MRHRRPHRPREFPKYPLALYVGGMGSKKPNFHNRFVRRYGYEKEAEETQDLNLSKGGERSARKSAGLPRRAAHRHRVGGYVKDRFAEFEESGATTLLCQVMGFDQAHRLNTLETLSKLV